MDKTPRSLEEALEKKLTAREKRFLVKSFDIIGDVAVIDVPKELSKKAGIIGKALLQVHKNVRTVCRRAGIHEGKYRVRQVSVIAGEKNTETTYRESGVAMKLDVSEAFFSPRLSHERERIAGLVKQEERVAVFFAGVGPFALVIAKKQPKCSMVAVELNPGAFKYLVENIRLNRAQEIITPIKGDVKKVSAGLGKFDRIVMPLPKSAEDFLDAAFKCSKKGTVINFYQFGPRDNPFAETLSKLKQNGEKKVRVLFKRVVRPYSPSKVQIVIDFKVL